MHWKDRFNKHAQKFADTDFFQHVSKTVNGTAISAEQFSAIIGSIDHALELRSKSSLLDLCCGNGVVTKELARLCASVDAIDFSESLIDIALNHNQLPNIAYRLGSILDLEDLLGASHQRYDCVCMYEALQCFAKVEISTILEQLRPLCRKDSTIFIGSVPDADRIWDFYNTPERRTEYYERVADGTEAIGTWWEKNEIEVSATQAGYSVEFRPQPSILHTAHYRFDMLLMPNWD